MEAIEVSDVSKRFRLYHEKLTSLKERILHFGRVPYEDFWALRDISLSINEGETFGLLGHNGSGKSTLLKCIAGILKPTSGEIRTRGRIASMLELGAGFHPDLTGRENVYLNASLLGLSKADVDNKFDEIVEFAELEQFIDNQVKFYSSGMYVRLGFAVAVNMDPEILLVDEVLTVGDELFQRKCLDRVRNFQQEGRTIVVVTHSADLVRQICSRAAVLEEGNLISVDVPTDAIRTYREHLIARQEARGLAHEEAEMLRQLARGEVAKAKPTHEIRILGVEVRYPDPERSHILPGEKLTVLVHYDAKQPTDDVAVDLFVYDLDGNNLFGANTDDIGVQLGTLSGEGAIVYEFASVPLLDGDYALNVSIHTHDQLTIYDFQEQKERFGVKNPERSVGKVYVPISVSVQTDNSLTH